VLASVAAEAFRARQVRAFRVVLNPDKADLELDLNSMEHHQPDSQVAFRREARPTAEPRSRRPTIVAIHSADRVRWVPRTERVRPVQGWVPDWIRRWNFVESA